jgi:PTH1 family peptidyl-tRNA hydrolase
VDTWLVIGLGNPGPAYAGNRHNVGAMVVEELANRYGSPAAVASATKPGKRPAAAAFRPHRSRALVREVRLGTASGGAPGPRAVLAVPTTFMNDSGGSVSSLLKFFSVDPTHLIVVHDELDIPAGTVRLKRGGGEGGHNGLRSVTKSLGSKDYLRVRVGIGRPPGRMDPADFVLKSFSATERAALPFTLGAAADAVESLVEVGLLEAQQRFHAP